MQIRPHSAVQSHHHSRVYSNQNLGCFFKLDHQGKQIKVNKLGDLMPKFVDNFTGFVNHKERKKLSYKDKSLMYSQPNLHYQKQSNPIHPKGTKFLGYTQYPYDLSGSIPQFLEEQTYKKSYQVRNSKKSMQQKSRYSKKKIQQKQNDNTFERKQRKIKTFKSQCSQFISFDEPLEMKHIRSSRFSQSNMKKQGKNEKSLILDASLKYGVIQRIKSANNKSSSSFHSTNVSNNLTKQSDSNRQTSYFSQSLFNIEKTETPNFCYENKSDPICSFMKQDTFVCPFNQTSINSRCYKSSCQSPQHIPKKRYKKEQNQQKITFNKNQIEKQLQNERKQTKLVMKLKESLKIYQPVPVQKQLIENQQNDKNNKKDKTKTNVTKMANQTKK